jgi:thioredoxin-related protein
MRLIFTIVFCFFLYSGYTQEIKIYNPATDVSSAIKQGLVKAKAENKYLFLQIGGDWCPWCHKFYHMRMDDPDIRTLMGKNYIPIMVNYSKENKNLTELKKLDFPQRFGFPVFVVLDSNGKRIHTQNSAYLEEGEGYSKKKVLDFLTQWSPDALNPDHYKDK